MMYMSLNKSFTMRMLARGVRGFFSFGPVNVFRSVIFNFKYLPFKVALRFPVLISGKLVVKNLSKGCIVFDISSILMNTIGPHL